MKVLCVAEKPSIAKSITEILSGGRWDTVSHLRRQAEGKAPECPECSVSVGWCGDLGWRSRRMLRRRLKYGAI